MIHLSQSQYDSAMVAMLQKVLAKCRAENQVRENAIQDEIAKLLALPSAL